MTPGLNCGKIMNGKLIKFSDPDMTSRELEGVYRVLGSSDFSGGAEIEAFERDFARYVGRKYGVSFSGAKVAFYLCLKALGLGKGDTVILSACSWRETGQVLAWAEIVPRFVDIDYWSMAIEPSKIEKEITPEVKAIIGSNPNGHPADWQQLEKIAKDHSLFLIEDSTEAIGCSFKGRRVGSFGICSLFDFSQPSALVTGRGAMIVTDCEGLASLLRILRDRTAEERQSVVKSRQPYLGCSMSGLEAALGVAQLQRIDEILQKRKAVEEFYSHFLCGFEGIKDPYVSPQATEVHWFSYVVHLGTRFSKSSRDAIIEDLRRENIEAYPYCHPLHMTGWAIERGMRRGMLPITERVADRTIALPFHGQLSFEEVEFIVKNLKEASLNVGAGAAIY
ncbi:aminotransferase class I/II-fold pyridoxal phosphate-dependent enzyme [Candidatus Methylacidiphilum infernorum]|uniref:Aminotransferase class I/II-fold pyridoxal phosphate-dependent enzyme n=2 Tax=Candidatus Methylacidiphilum infernorum TaxID=511746 RepID=A0ABX7PUK3_9BACT|nr:aminotransferase class I/II-fold pyridoxal phosphate-dependent enzyme [Candidatus Methylacidiphilum infernorum]